MVIMFTERIFLKQRVEEIREEKNKLNEEYMMIKQRLKELDEIEREAIDAESVIFKLTEAVKSLSKLIPPVPIDVIINHLQKENIISDEKIIKDNIEEKENIIIDNKKIEEQKDKDIKKSKFKRKSTKDIKDVSFITAKYLKDKGRPTKSSDIEKYLKEEYNMEWNNFTTAIKNMMVYEPKIKRAYRGFYQYIGE